MRFSAMAQALEIRRAGAANSHEMRSDSKLVYSKWSDAIGQPSAEEVAKGGLQGRDGGSGGRTLGIDVGSASIDQLDMLLQQFLTSSRPEAPMPEL